MNNAAITAAIRRKSPAKAFWFSDMVFKDADFTRSRPHMAPPQKPDHCSKVWCRSPWSCGTRTELVRSFVRTRTLLLAPTHREVLHAQMASRVRPGPLQPGARASAVRFAVVSGARQRNRGRRSAGKRRGDRAAIAGGDVRIRQLAGVG